MAIASSQKSASGIMCRRRFFFEITMNLAFYFDAFDAPLINETGGKRFVFSRRQLVGVNDVNHCATAYIISTITVRAVHSNMS